MKPSRRAATRKARDVGRFTDNGWERTRATERHAAIRCILARSNRNRLSEFEDRIGTTRARG